MLGSGALVDAWSAVHIMRSQLEPLQLRDFILVAFWLGVKIVAGLVIGAALFETVGLVVGLITMATGG
jgi:hypothetical protein